MPSRALFHSIGDTYSKPCPCLQSGDGLTERSRHLIHHLIEIASAANRIGNRARLCSLPAPLLSAVDVSASYLLRSDASCSTCACMAAV